MNYQNTKQFLRKFLS
ncbi:hypothetical protein CP03DC29_1339A, partial [Chlamydia psittaci 03DC29]